ncbi:hypothetical protein [Nocardia brasiliensis]|uniref:hypothetical protein n=1 Tax=Nocardia brasiliensis TaxID=37326 RepID=UPI002454FD93|nr:hypothetical protein [Nocardia brasiliensis]
MAVIGRRGRAHGAVDNDPEHVFKRVREVETQLRVALAIFRDHLDELESEIDQNRKEV